MLLAGGRAAVKTLASGVAWAPAAAAELTPQDRQDLASMIRTPAVVLRRLAADSDSDVRVSLARNPKCDASTVHLVGSSWLALSAGRAP